MSDRARDLLAAFDAMPHADQVEVMAELFRRLDDCGPLTDEALTEVAGQLARMYDADEEAAGAPDL